MRVIAGKYKGKKLVCPKGEVVRPTSDKVKEAMFGVLQFGIIGAYVLDAFAGSGALGIEALSRGAAHVDFIEKKTVCIRAIKNNLNIVSEKALYDLYQGDALKLIPALKGRGYDIIFLDPPYDSNLYYETLLRAAESRIVRKGTKIVVECRKTFDFKLPMKYNFTKRKDYGDISLLFLEYGEECD